MRPLTTAATEPRLRSNGIEFGSCRIAFQRTLRIPDDGRTYPLPPGLGTFPVLPVSHFADRVPDDWRRHGGVFIPMHQREALWIDFTGSDGFEQTAVKVGIGKVNAVTGDPWDDRLPSGSAERTQDYLVVPKQPWLDGINVGNGRIRQFVAVPLGSDYTVEGQVTGEEVWGGIQFLMVPGKPRPRPEAPPRGTMMKRIERARPAADGEPMVRVHAQALQESPSAMGLGAGGTMDQKVYPDPFGIRHWDQAQAGRVFVHIANAAMFREITGKEPPPSPVSAADYSRNGLPWFGLYDSDEQSLAASETLADVWSIRELDEARIGPAAYFDPSIEVSDNQVATIHRSRGGTLDGEW